MLNEFVINSIKHAFDETGDKWIRFTCDNVDGNIVIVYEDSGDARYSEMEKMGLDKTVIDSLVKQADVDLEYINDNFDKKVIFR